MGIYAHCPFPCNSCRALSHPHYPTLMLMLPSNSMPTYPTPLVIICPLIPPCSPLCSPSFVITDVRPQSLLPPHYFTVVYYPTGTSHPTNPPHFFTLLSQPAIPPYTIQPNRPTTLSYSTILLHYQLHYPTPILQ